MGVHKTFKPRSKPRISASPVFIMVAAAVALLLLLCSMSSIMASLSPYKASEIVAPKHQHTLHDKYLYWGNRIDCPGKHCDSCEGLGHQESSLRCALEEAMFLKRTFVMPSRMCINPIHNKKGILYQSAKDTSEEGFMECKNRNNRSAIMLPYKFLPSMAAKPLRDAANKIKAFLGDYDAIHVRRGDKIKTRKDRSGVDRSLHPHLDRDTRPEFILLKIKRWVPPGRTVFIASNERTPGFFSPMSVRYKLAYSSNYSRILDPVIKNNYQIFMIERLIMMGAKTFIRTFKEEDADLALCDDPKKNTKVWQIPVYTMDEEAN
ncbi:hypothetical protein SAY87_001353 [Trapa incisa]|uniref:O-fucosyltransferase family protein n=1 Tax=Trapa incisa TaxID=236973 RepID=A0AAN7GV50_9MYRT|nr:hypothetical protein SAY87_001353 [Trapa incisa]